MIDMIEVGSRGSRRGFAECRGEGLAERRERGIDVAVVDSENKGAGERIDPDWHDFRRCGLRVADRGMLLVLWCCFCFRHVGQGNNGCSQLYPERDKTNPVAHDGVYA